MRVMCLKKAPKLYLKLSIYMAFMTFFKADAAKYFIHQ